MSEHFAELVARLAHAWINGNRSQVREELELEAAISPDSGVALTAALMHRLAMRGNGEANDVATHLTMQLGYSATSAGDRAGYLETPAPQEEQDR